MGRSTATLRPRGGGSCCTSVGVTGLALREPRRRTEHKARVATAYRWEEQASFHRTWEQRDRLYEIEIMEVQTTVSLQAHDHEKLKAAVQRADTLSAQMTALLIEGAKLDDPAVVSLHKKRIQEYEDINEYRAAKEADEKELHMTQQQERNSRLRAGMDSQSIETHGQGIRDFIQPMSPGIGSAAPTPFHTFGQQMIAVARHSLQPGNNLEPGLQEIQNYQLGLGESIPSGGGFLVQPDFATELMRRVHETGKLIDRPKRVPLTGSATGLKINAVDETSRVDGSRLGGVQSYWTAEAATLTKSKPTFRQVELTLHKLTGLYFATDEELADAGALDETVASFYAEEFGFKLDDALIRGTGAGEPLGILGHAGTVSIAKESGQAANTILVENVEKMFSRLWARAIDPVWLINSDVWPQLFALSKAVGVGGVPVFLPAGSMSGKPFQTLLGLPIIAIEQCETLGTLGDIILADFETGYIMIDKGGIDSAVSIHVQFLTDESVFRFILRTDGQPIANAPLTPYKGTLKQSSFVTLDTRA